MTDVHCQREGDARRKVGNLKRLGSALCGVYGVLVYTTRGGSARYDSARDVSARDVSARDVSARDVSARDGSARDGSARDVSARDVSARDGRFRETPVQGSQSEAPKAPRERDRIFIRLA